MSPPKHQHPELTQPLLWVMAIATGLIVANLYYNQPLLVIIAKTYHVNDAKVRQVAALTQLGYATGMLFIAPLADMLRRKRLILACLAVCVFALLASAAAPDINLLVIASFFMGIFSLIPQLLVPMAAHLAKPAERGRRIGFVMSGLLIGILLSRTISGFVGAHLGWRAMFYIAAGLMVVMWLLLFAMLPEVEPEYNGTYKSLMASLGSLIKHAGIAYSFSAGRSVFCVFQRILDDIDDLIKREF